MKNIFLSRPNWVGKEFEKGLNAFTNILKSYDLNPRTLGVSDYPSNTPLDEVISIMDECVGAIVLGYPQIVVKEGVLKGKSIDTSITLATEWNHIEASLAYAKKLSLLVVHHKGVQRGIFDRGAIGKFLYEVNLSDSTWFTDEKIIGAINTWKKGLTETSSEISAIAVQQDDLVFEKTSGTYLSKKGGDRYCHKCLHSSSKEIPLKEQKNGWHCSVCGAFYRNPNYNPPTHSAYTRGPRKLL